MQIRTKWKVEAATGTSPTTLRDGGMTRHRLIFVPIKGQFIGESLVVARVRARGLEHFGGGRHMSTTSMGEKSRASRGQRDMPHFPLSSQIDLQQIYVCTLIHIGESSGIHLKPI